MKTKIKKQLILYCKADNQDISIALPHVKSNWYMCYLNVTTNAAVPLKSTFLSKMSETSPRVASLVCSIS